MQSGIHTVNIPNCQKHCCTHGISTLCRMPNALQAKPLCGVLGANALIDKGSWHRETASGHLFWEPSECRLRRLTAQEARSCLAGRTIAFVGDSVTRRASPYIGTHTSEACVGPTLCSYLAKPPVCSPIQRHLMASH